MSMYNSLETCVANSSMPTVLVYSQKLSMEVQERPQRVEYFGACPFVEKQKPSTESTSLNQFLLHNSHHASPFLSAEEQIPACCVCGRFVP